MNTVSVQLMLGALELALCPSDDYDTLVTSIYSRQ